MYQVTPKKVIPSDQAQNEQQKRNPQNCNKFELPMSQPNLDTPAPISGRHPTETRMVKPKQPPRKPRKRGKMAHQCEQGIRQDKHHTQ